MPVSNKYPSPKFGQVWKWRDSKPMLVIGAPDGEYESWADGYCLTLMLGEGASIMTWGFHCEGWELLEDVE